MLRDTDSGEQANRLLILTWSLVAGLVGGLAGLLVARSNGWATAPTMIAGFFSGALLAYFGVGFFSDLTADAASTIYAPGGGRTPGPLEYSHAESLVARARYDEALRVYQRHAAEHPEDPEPLLRIARLYRDRLEDNDHAARYLREARDTAEDRGIRLLATRELIELYTNRMGQPMRALPELARLAGEYPDQPTGAWAARELARLKKEPE